MAKEDLLNQIKEYYLTSGDFNGMPIYQMKTYPVEELIELINEDKVEVLSEKEVLNPHIKGFEIGLKKEIQIKRVLEKSSCTCFYPTRKALLDVQLEYQEPYKMLLQQGEFQFKIVFFNIEILQIYTNNPQYYIADYGYSGNIDLNPEYYDDELCNEFVKEYGMAYEKGNGKINRAVGVFVRDLARLSAPTQMRWKSYELANQEDYMIEEGFYKNAILGEFVTKYWIMDALLEEMSVINNQCNAIGLPELFHKTYGTFYSDRPEGYSTLLLPTRKNYYDFVLVLEKLFVHNINIKAFLKDCGIIKAVERKDSNGKDKGSLVLFKEWLLKNVRANFDMEQVIISPLRNIRRIRQVPAHELYDDKFDTDLYEKQKDLVEDVYDAIYALRRLLMGHPLARNVEVPEYLLNRKEIVFY